MILTSACATFLSCESTKSAGGNTATKIESVYSYGFIDLEGAKLSAIIVEFDGNVPAKSVGLDTFSVTNYTKYLKEKDGREKAIEVDYDGIEGNEGEITKVYVTSEKAPAKKGEKSGRYVVIELNTDYMLSSQNLVYTTSMMAGVKQEKDIQIGDTVIKADGIEYKNYTMEEVRGFKGRMQTEIQTDKSKIIFPQFADGSGWTLHHIGEDAFKATGCYSEYTGKYEDFEFPYSIYVPDQKTLDANKGKIALVIHMEHAGANDSDPLAAITSSKAAVKLSSPDFQKKHPAIVVVPQIEESRRSTDDMDASSEANPAVWQLLDSILAEYKGYIDENRIYGTGQSMGGMTILYMASQRDNFFAGIAVVGSQWSNNYDKDIQHKGAVARTPENDSVSFNGFGLDSKNFQNWYYMVSDDNILVHTCAGDPMATGEWGAVREYFAACGVTVPYAEWDPYLTLSEQNENDRNLTNHPTTRPGSGINWAAFTKGSHMSTWKYGYQLDAPFEWLFEQTRQSENARGKIEQLKNPWLGRNADGSIKEGSGTSGLNSAQYTPNGASEKFGEGWTREGAR